MVIESVIFKNLSYIPAVIIGWGCPYTACQALIYLMLIDTFCGVVKAYRIKKGHGVKSRILTSGILAKATVLLIPMTIVLVGKGVDIEVKGLIGSVVFVLILSEAYSILGNIEAIRTGKNVEEIDAVSTILRQLRKLIEKILQKTKLD